MRAALTEFLFDAEEQPTGGADVGRRPDIEHQAVTCVTLRHDDNAKPVRPAPVIVRPQRHSFDVDLDVLFLLRKQHDRGRNLGEGFFSHSVQSCDAFGATVPFDRIAFVFDREGRFERFVIDRILHHFVSRLNRHLDPQCVRSRPRARRRRFPANLQPSNDLIALGFIDPFPSDSLRRMISSAPGHLACSG